VLRENAFAFSADSFIRQGESQVKRVLPVIALMAVSTGNTTAAEQADLEKEGARVGYSIGYQVGSDFRQQGVKIDPQLVLRGVQDALAGSDPLLQQSEMDTVLAQLQQRVSAQTSEGSPDQSTPKPAGAESFLAENARKEGVVQLPSGLQYKVIASGSGVSPAAKDTVTVHYRGTLIDGTEFDSSYRRNAPATFPVNRVIAGWTEALQLMREGDKWQLFIPPGLAYGNRAVGGKIPANSLLIFEVELISVN